MAKGCGRRWSTFSEPYLSKVSKTLPPNAVKSGRGGVPLPPNGLLSFSPARFFWVSLTWYWSGGVRGDGTPYFLQHLNFWLNLWEGSNNLYHFQGAGWKTGVLAKLIDPYFSCMCLSSETGCSWNINSLQLHWEELPKASLPNAAIDSMNDRTMESFWMRSHSLFSIPLFFQRNWLHWTNSRIGLCWDHVQPCSFLGSCSGLWN